MAINAIIRFLQAARNLAKQGMSKEQILDFARREFGEVSKLLRKQIDDIFKAKPKTEKKGGIVDIKTRKEYKKELDEALGPDDDVFGSPIKDQKMKEFDKINAKKVVEERTKDIAKGDVEGTGVESLETSIKKIKETADEMKELSKKTTPEGIMKEILKGQKVMSENYKTGNIRTAVREFMRSEEKAGRLKLNETDSFRIREYSPMTEDDPIDVFRRYYGEDALDAVDDIGDVFQQGESFSHYEQLLRQNVDPKILTVKKTGAGEYDASVVAGEKIRKAKEQEAKNKQLLEEFEIDPDREPNAYGGIAGNLRLNRTGYFAGKIVKGYKVGQGAFTKAQVLIQRLENTIKEYKGKTDELAKYVQETFPKFIKEIKANPKLADNENVWKELGQDLPSNQELVVYGDDTVDFFRQTEGPGNIERVTKFLQKNPFLNKEEAIKIMKMEPTDQVMEVERLKTIRTKKHALGGRVQMAHGGLINILKL